MAIKGITMLNIDQFIMQYTYSCLRGPVCSDLQFYEFPDVFLIYKFVRTKMRPKEGTKIELQREICQILSDLLELQVQICQIC